MRVLLLTEFYYDFSTFRLCLENLAQIYSSRGHRVTAAGCSLPRASSSPVEKRPWGRIFRHSTELLARVVPTLVAEADVVHLHTTGSWTDVLAKTAAACRRKPLVVTFQDWGNPALPEPGPRVVRRWSDLFRRSAAVTAVSRGTAARLVHAFPNLEKRVRLVPNGVEDTFFERPKTSLSRQRPFILCPARLSPYKGIDVALWAWKDADIPGVDLVFCGEDHAQGRFQRLARLLGLSSRTRFVGAVDREEIRGLMRSCLFALLPSRHESFGVVAVEAMASAKAVLSTRVDGPSDIVVDGGTGLLVKPQDAGALREGILRLWRQPRLRERMGRAGLERAESYRWENAARRYASLYAQATDE